jgi:TatD DNase family protein
LRYYDAHNHLQDERLQRSGATETAELRRLGIGRIVVNGSCEEDWQAVLDLAKTSDLVLPSFGYHPWYVRERTPEWQTNLRKFVEAVPSAIGEVGLDRWIKDYDLPAQEEVFVWQLRLAAERNLPISIHCLQAWGLLLDILRREPRPNRGFLLHSYGGSVDLVEPLAELGAYFSLSGYFAHERKARQREAFRRVPVGRLLIETDAPDMLPPEKYIRRPLRDSATNTPLNDPANLPGVYEFAATLREQPLDELAAQVEKNFQRLFGPISPASDRTM